MQNALVKNVTLLGENTHNKAAEKLYHGGYRIYVRCLQIIYIYISKNERSAFGFETLNRTDYNTLERVASACACICFSSPILPSIPFFSFPTLLTLRGREKLLHFLRQT